MGSRLTHRTLDLAIVGTRGIPANYGGFETFAEELSIRLARRGHRVTVYGRSHFVPAGMREYRGVQIRVLPCIRHKYLDTVTHTALAILSAMIARHDALLICNAANAFLAGLPAVVGQKVVLNVDGIERQRKKWNALGRAAYQAGEFLATLLPDAVIADAEVIQEYYQQEHGFRAHFIPYGAPAETVSTTEALDRLGLKPGGYVLYVSRLEPENNADLVIAAYLQSGAPVPLVIVGAAPYSDDYIESLRRQAAGGNVIMPGAIYGKGYRELLSHCLCYVQATEVGGTHPALLEAMGAGALVIANDTPEHREALGHAGLTYRFNDVDSLALLLRAVVCSPGDYRTLGARAQERIRQCYDWESVADRYEELFMELVEA